MDPISRVVYRNYTLTLCNENYPNAFELGDGSWVSYRKQLKLIRALKSIREACEQYATLSSFVFRVGGRFTDKDLRDSQFSQLMKHSRKTITGREVFLGRNGKNYHHQLDHFGLKIPPYSWKEQKNKKSQILRGKCY